MGEGRGREGGRGSPECAEGLVVVDVSWTNGGNHGRLGVPTKTVLQQPLEMGVRSLYNNFLPSLPLFPFPLPPPPSPHLPSSPPSSPSLTM